MAAVSRSERHAKIVGLEGLSPGETQDELRRGARFVIFTYCISLLVVTFKRGTDIHFIRTGQGAVGKGMPYRVLSFFFGWWGFPFGLITRQCASFRTSRVGRT